MSLLPKVSTKAFLFCALNCSLCSATNAVTLAKLRSSRGKKAAKHQLSISQHIAFFNCQQLKVTNKKVLGPHPPALHSYVLDCS